MTTLTAKQRRSIYREIDGASPQEIADELRVDVDLVATWQAKHAYRDELLRVRGEIDAILTAKIDRMVREVPGVMQSIMKDDENPPSARIAAGRALWEMSTYAEPSTQIGGIVVTIDGTLPPLPDTLPPPPQLEAPEDD